MDRDEMREILETIARESANPTAPVSAIRALRQLDEEGRIRRPGRSRYSRRWRVRGSRE
jgi:hypothetical protein